MVTGLRLVARITEIWVNHPCVRSRVETGKSEIPPQHWALPCEVLLPGTSGLLGGQGVVLTRIPLITRNIGEDDEHRVTPG